MRQGEKASGRNSEIMSTQRKRGVRLFQEIMTELGMVAHFNLSTQDVEAIGSP